MMDDEPRPAEPRRSARQIQDDVDEELRFHLEMRAAELEAAGLDPAAARDEAARRFGDVAETQRACAASDDPVLPDEVATHARPPRASTSASSAAMNRSL